MRILQWTVALLVLCNVALMLTIWLKPHPGHPPGGESPRDYVIRNVRFTDDQIKQYDVLIKKHRDQMKQLRDSADEYRKQLFSGLKDDAGNNDRAENLAKFIGETEKNIELATYAHFKEVRKICTESQKAEFDKILGETIKRMHGEDRPHRKGPPPGHGRPGEDGPPPPPGEDGPPPPDAPQNH